MLKTTKLFIKNPTLPLLAMRKLPYTTCDDGELLTFLRDGDNDAFTEIYNRYYKRVYSYILDWIKLPDRTEDLVHEVFIKLWEIRDKLQIRDNFAGYLFRLCHNKMVDTTRTIVRERKFKDQLLAQYQQIISDEQVSPQQLQRFDNLAEEALSTLPPVRKKVYELCRLQKRSYQEIADELNISPHTVRDHMSKALATLRIFLREKEDFLMLLILAEIFF